jgi:hypothetical protein
MKHNNIKRIIFYAVLIFIILYVLQKVNKVLNIDKFMKNLFSYSFSNKINNKEHFSDINSGLILHLKLDGNLEDSSANSNYKLENASNFDDIKYSTGYNNNGKAL